MNLSSPVVLPTAPYLIISRIGNDSLHGQWLSGAGRGRFDVLLSSYHSDIAAVEEPGVLFEVRPGSKVAGYGAILNTYASLISQYRYVSLFDDDLSIEADDLLALFRMIDQHGFKIAQPSLDHDSFFTYAALLHHPGMALRHVNFVEMMCPFFRSDILLALAPLFELGFESGIDLIWSAMIHREPKDFAVIDSLPVRHTRPVGAVKSINGFVDGRSYETDINGILKQFDVPWLPVLPYSAIRLSGATVEDRHRLFLHALSLVRAVPIRDAKFRLTAVMKYWRQLLRGPARNVPASLP